MVGDLLQPTHLLFVLVVALLVLGPKRLPEVGRALGRGLRDFRSAISGEEPLERTISPSDEETSASTSTPAAARQPPEHPEASSTATATPPAAVSEASPPHSSPPADDPASTAGSDDKAEAVTTSMRSDSPA